MNVHMNSKCSRQRHNDTGVLCLQSHMAYPSLARLTHAIRHCVRPEAHLLQQTAMKAPFTNVHQQNTKWRIPTHKSLHCAILKDYVRKPCCGFPIGHGIADRLVVRRRVRTGISFGVNMGKGGHLPNLILQRRSVGCGCALFRNLACYFDNRGVSTFERDSMLSGSEAEKFVRLQRQHSAIMSSAQRRTQQRHI